VPPILFVKTNVHPVLFNKPSKPTAAVEVENYVIHLERDREDQDLLTEQYDVTQSLLSAHLSSSHVPIVVARCITLR